MKRLLTFVAVFLTGTIAVDNASAEMAPPKRAFPARPLTALKPPDVLPAPKEIPLPSPKELPPTELVWPPRLVPMYAPGPELGKRNIWETYSVNSRGQFVPRVVVSPGGYYYQHNGRPYPWEVLGTSPYRP